MDCIGKAIHISANFEKKNLLKAKVLEYYGISVFFNKTWRSVGVWICVTLRTDRL